MKRRIALFAAPLLMGSLAFVIPAVSHAGVGTGNCVVPTPTGTAKPSPSGNVVSLAPLDPSGKVWVNTSKPEVGANGSHGYFEANSSNVRGHSTDSTLNGQVKNNGASSTVCVSVAGNKISAP